MDGEIVLTPAALLDLLTQIDELKDKDIGVTQGLDGMLQLQIGNSMYEIREDNATEISVDESVTSEINQANIDAYNDLANSDNIEFFEDSISNVPVQSGIIKELIKTLAVGGIVRFAANKLKK